MTSRTPDDGAERVHARQLRADQNPPPVSGDLVLVPRVPSEAMRDAARWHGPVIPAAPFSHTLTGAQAHECWRAMISAALASSPSEAEGRCPRCDRGEIEAYDDGSWVELGMSAGGAHELGMWGCCELIYREIEGSETRRTYIAKDRLPADPPSLDRALKAVRLALPILDDDLESFKGHTPPRLMDARGFVCLDDLSCDHDRWKDCERTLMALSAFRDVLPPDEWEANTYVESQAAVEHFRLALLRSTQEGSR